MAMMAFGVASPVQIRVPCANHSFAVCWKIPLAIWIVAIVRTIAGTVIRVIRVPVRMVPIVVTLALVAIIRIAVPRVVVLALYPCMMIMIMVSPPIGPRQS